MSDKTDEKPKMRKKPGTENCQCHKWGALGCIICLEVVE